MLKFLNKIFNSRTIAVFFLFIELLVFITVLVFFDEYFAEVKSVFSIIGVIVAFFIFNSKMNSSYKITWLVILVIVPIFGSLCYIMFANKKFTRRQKKKLMPTVKSLIKATETQSNSVLEKIDKEKEPDAYYFGKYLNDYSFNGIYENTNVTYYAWGEDAWKVMLEKMESAKHYIFMEYFIIQEGLMWNSMLEILKRKAQEGLDVRLLYDDVGCLKTLPHNYFKQLRKFGIKAYAVNRVRAILDIRMNNRDHRKIMVIDGHTGFTGGINLADEYINHIERFGKWKDNAIMIEGDAVFGLNALFLSHWSNLNRKSKPITNWKPFLPTVYKDEVPPLKKTSGYVAPYGFLPMSYEIIGENVYLSLINKARKYIYITTPYLIMDEQLNNALILAAKGGIKIKLLTPHIPDKKTVFDLTRSYYRDLIEAGVEVYEYTPGFVHAKTFLVDGEIATVGTINLDFRSLYLHMENGCFLYKCDCVKDIEKDMIETFAVSKQITHKMVLSAPAYKRLFRAILRLVAPAM